MKHKKLLRKQGGSASGGSASNGNQSDENCEEEKSNAGDSIAETGDIDDNEERSGESLDARDRGSNIENSIKMSTYLKVLLCRFGHRFFAQFNVECQRSSELVSTPTTVVYLSSTYGYIHFESRIATFWWRWRTFIQIIKISCFSN